MVTTGSQAFANVVEQFNLYNEAALPVDKERAEALTLGCLDIAMRLKDIKSVTLATTGYKLIKTLPWE